MIRIAASAIGLSLILWSSVALAKESTAAPEEEVQATPVLKAETALAPTGPRVRFGIAGGGGPVFIVGGQEGPLGSPGVDLRLGLQINNAVAVYLQPQVGFLSNSFGIGALIGASALFDYTIKDSFFLGIGGGILHAYDLTGPGVHLRIGAYPFMEKLVGKARRQALMVGVDLRAHIVGGTDGTAIIIAPTLNIGYEAF